MQNRYTKKFMQTSIKSNLEVSRDGRIKKYTNRSSRDNKQLTRCIPKLFFIETLLLENVRCRVHLVDYLLSILLLFAYFLTLPSLLISPIFLFVLSRDVPDIYIYYVIQYKWPKITDQVNF